MDEGAVYAIPRQPAQPRDGPALAPGRVRHWPLSGASTHETAGVGGEDQAQIPLTTQSKHDLPVADNVFNRQFKPAQPNRAWVADITYVWTVQGWLYLAVVMDLYSRRIVGWCMDRTMTQALAIRALKMAINLRQPKAGLIHHSDRGSQYASEAYQTLQKQHGILPSMSRKGNCWDNAVMERFFKSYK
jgi:putative transposase